MPSSEQAPPPAAPPAPEDPVPPVPPAEVVAAPLATSIAATQSAPRLDHDLASSMPPSYNLDARPVIETKTEEADHGHEEESGRGNFDAVHAARSFVRLRRARASHLGRDHAAA